MEENIYCFGTKTAGSISNIVGVACGTSKSEGPEDSGRPGSGLRRKVCARAVVDSYRSERDYARNA